MFHLPEVKFDPGQLKKLMSVETFEYHYGKHHDGYVKKTNELLETPEFKHLAGESLEQICQQAESPLVQQARQAWNHTFYWDCLRGGIQPVPDTGNKKTDKNQWRLLEAVQKSFGSQKDFEQEFKKQAIEIFGSGWLWLVYRDNEKRLDLVKAEGADQPFWGNSKPLLVCDVWEHAYYIDYRNERKDYIDAFWSHIDWSFAEANLISFNIYSATARMTQKEDIWKNQQFREKHSKSI